jgi:hypothetical protein
MQVGLSMVIEEIARIGNYETQIVLEPWYQNLNITLSLHPSPILVNTSQYEQLYIFFISPKPFP